MNGAHATPWKCDVPRATLRAEAARSRGCTACRRHRRIVCDHRLRQDRGRRLAHCSTRGQHAGPPASPATVGAVGRAAVDVSRHEQEGRLAESAAGARNQRASWTWPSSRASCARVSWTTKLGEYGHLVVDECHHLPAFSFEQVARRAIGESSSSACPPLLLARTATIQSSSCSAVPSGIVSMRRSRRPRAPLNTRWWFVLRNSARWRRRTRMPVGSFMTCTINFRADEARNRLICEDIVQAA